MRRIFGVTLIAFFGCLMALAPSALGAATAQAATTWTPTATQGLSLVNATALGAAPAAQPLHITVSLALRNKAALDQYIHDINDPSNTLFGAELSPSDFVAQYGPTSDQVAAVTSYLTSAGLTNVQVEPNNLLVTADGTAAQVQSAFDTQIGLFSLNGATVYANTTAAQVPASLSGIVASVLGLNNVSAQHAKPAAPSASLPNYPASYTPQGFQKAYDALGTPTGSKTNIAIFAEGDLTQTLKDLRAEEAANGLPQVPVTVEQVGLASSDTAGVDEWDMDTQYSTGMAQTVNHLYLYDATSLTDSDLALGFSRFVTQKLAKAGSASFGECEVFPYVSGAMLADDELFAEAAAQGQTVFASSGDTGGFCPVGPVGVNGAPAGAPFVNYPASSPYVVAAGGTTLLTNGDGSYNSELAWTTSGGGVSQFESAPYWQSGIVPATAVGKGVPDIAMDADPNSGATVYYDGQPATFGGTSLSSPLSLGVWARLESSHNNALGFAGPRLYKAYQTAAFHDITLGDASPYPALPGYDYATGIGTFDVAQANTIIR